MTMVVPYWRQVKVVLRGEPARVARWTQELEASRIWSWLIVAVLGSGMFGAAMGWWRAPEQAVYTAIKFPVVVLVTMMGNAVLNAMLAPLLGVNIGLRQSLLAVMMSFAIAAAIMGATSPLLAFFIWNTPPLEDQADSGGVHAAILLMIVAMVAFAGVVANLRLFQLLREISGSNASAKRVLLAWLAGNLFLGSQMSWILRPFIGSPGLPVQFLRDEPMKGSFFEAVYWSALRVLSSN